MNPHLQRAILLYDQRRPELAENELRQSLAGEPGDGYAHALLGLCLLERKQFRPATDETQQAIGLAPDLAFTHYALARVMDGRDRLDESVAAIREAIRLEPADADYHGMLAALEFQRRDWKAALASAETGLEFDAEHVACNNLRAMALTQLGQRAAAGATIDAALSRDPGNSLTHANRGWTLLHAGGRRDRETALGHFRESLRLDPENTWARAGIVEALKAGNPVYALLLRYFLWMSRLSGRAQAAVLIGFYVIGRIPGLRVPYLIFALMTWLADPLFNLLLRLNRDGRLALTEEQTRASGWVGFCLGMSALCTGWWALAGFPGKLLPGALVCGALALPVAGVWKVQLGWPRQVMVAVAGTLAALGLAGAFLAALTPGRGGNLPTSSPAVMLLSLFALGWVASTWGINLLAAVRPKR